MKPNPDLVRSFLARNRQLLAPAAPPALDPEAEKLERYREMRRQWSLRQRADQRAARRAVGTPMTREELAAWNAKHPMWSRLPDGRVIRSRAWLTRLGLAVVRVEGQEKFIDVPKETL